ncbi:MAG: hypothetical protein LBK72_00045, partial [Bifidobacteriaceae bacterium]|nr:hypothetical protein [Bifidobacteriaceae bacterium]
MRRIGWLGVIGLVLGSGAVSVPAAAATAPGMDPDLRACVAAALGISEAAFDPSNPAVAGLTTLDCGFRGIASLDGIGLLTGLKDLDLTYNAVADPAPLTALPGLERLSLWENPVGDFSWLPSMTGLVDLDLTHTGLVDLTPVAGLTGLERLAIGDTSLLSIDHLDGASAAVTPRGGGSENQITDLTPLAGLTRLARLDLTMLDGIGL